MADNVLRGVVQVTAPGVQQTFNSVAAGANKTGAALKSIAPGANAANFALINTGRVIQDLPFGFIGIQNNLNPLLESFQRLKVETGSSGLALKALGKSLIGAGGIGFALSVASSAILLITQGFQSFSRHANKARQDSDAMKESIKNIAQSTAEDLSKLTVLVGVIENVNTRTEDREKALKALNEQYGKYLPNLDSEKISLENIAKSYDLIIDALLRQAVVKGLQKQIEEQVAKTAEQIIRYKQAEEKRAIAIEKTNQAAAKKAKDPMADAAKGLANYNKISKDGLLALTDQRAELIGTASDAGDYEEAIKRLTASLKEQLAPLLKISSEFADLGINLKADKVDHTIDQIIAKGKRLAAEFGDISKIHLDVLPTFSEIDTKAEQLAKAKQIIKDVNEFFTNFTSKTRALKLVIPLQPEPFVLPVNDPERTNEEISKIIKSFNPDEPFKIDISLQPAIKIEAEAANFGAAKLGTDFSNDFRTAVTANLSKGLGLEEAIRKAKISTDAFVELNKSLTNSIQQGFVDAFSAVGEGIGNILSGQDFGDQLFQVFGSLFQSIGKALLEFGIIKKGVEKILNNPLIPAAFAVGLGVFAIAAGSLIKNIKSSRRQSGGLVQAGQLFEVNENGREFFVPNTGGMIVPHNQAAGNMGNSFSTGKVVFEIHGNKLIGVLANASRSQGRLS